MGNKSFTLKLMTNKDLQTNLEYMMRWFKNMKVSSYIELRDRQEELLKK